jgi:hypothetical protein
MNVSCYVPVNIAPNLLQPQKGTVSGHKSLRLLFLLLILRLLQTCSAPDAVAAPATAAPATLVSPAQKEGANAASDMPPGQGLLL